jgi:N-acetylneuraminate lyase
MMLYTAGNRQYVGSTYNYMGDIYRQMVAAHHNGETEKVVELEGEADAVYRLLTQHNGISAGKEIMRFLGVDCGTVRKPLKPFTKTESETLLQKLRDTTFFNYHQRREINVL